MKFLTLLTTAAGLLFASACASTQTQPVDNRFVVMPANELASITDEQAILDLNPRPNLIYASEQIPSLFTIKKQNGMESEVNERGFLAVRIFGNTAELPILKWAFFGDIYYNLYYKFLWFNADGKFITASDAFRLREAAPGEPVRFVGHAPTEECRGASLLLYIDSDIKPVKTAETAAPAAASTDEVNAAEAAEGAALPPSDPIDDDSYVLPALNQQNVAGDKKDTKIIGIPAKDAASTPTALDSAKKAADAPKK